MCPTTFCFARWDINFCTFSLEKGETFLWYYLYWWVYITDFYSAIPYQLPVSIGLTLMEGRKEFLWDLKLASSYSLKHEIALSYSLTFWDWTILWDMRIEYRMRWDGWFWNLILWDLRFDQENLLSILQLLFSLIKCTNVQDEQKNAQSESRFTIERNSLSSFDTKFHSFILVMISSSLFLVFIQSLKKCSMFNSHSSPSRSCIFWNSGKTLSASTDQRFPQQVTFRIFKKHNSNFESYFLSEIFFKISYLFRRCLKCSSLSELFLLSREGICKSAQK